MPTPILMVQLVHPLHGFGNTRQSISSEVSGANPGEVAPVIWLDDKQRFFEVTIKSNGKLRTCKLPMSNVVHFIEKEVPAVVEKPATVKK